MQILENPLILAPVVLSAITFFIWGYDKHRATSGGRRVKESFLLTLAFIGGGFGALLGMILFRHKTRKAKFKVLVPLGIVFSVFALMFISFSLGLDTPPPPIF